MSSGCRILLKTLMAFLLISMPWVVTSCHFDGMVDCVEDMDCPVGAICVGGLCHGNQCAAASGCFPGECINGFCVDGD